MINWIFFLFAIESSLFFTTTVWVPPFQTLCQTFKLDWKSFAIKKYHCAVCCAAAELSTSTHSLSSQWYQFNWRENVSQKPICSGWWTLAFSHLISSLCSWLKNCCLEWSRSWCFLKVGTLLGNNEILLLFTAITILVPKPSSEVITI